MLKITGEEVNFLIYQYMEESGYKHSAFTFQNEASLGGSQYDRYQLAPGMLLLFLEKALLLLQMETHLGTEEGEELNVCDQAFSLLNPHHCSYQGLNIEQPEFPEGKPLPPSPPGESKEGEASSKSIHQAGGGSKQTQNHGGNSPRTQGSEASVPLHSPHIGEIKEMGESEGESDMLLGLGDHLSHQLDHLQTGAHFQSNLALHSVRFNNSLQTLGGHKGDVFHVVWDTTGQLLFTGGHDGIGKVWAIGDQVQKAESINRLPHLDQSLVANKLTPSDITAAVWNVIDIFRNYTQPTDNILATGALDGILRIWDKEGNLLDLTLIHEGLINGLEWNSTGKYLLTAGDDGRVYVLDKANRHNGQMFEHGASVLDVSWKNEREFASGGVDGIIKLWHLGDDHPFNSFEACSGHIKSIKWDKAGSLLACSTQDTVLKIYSVLQPEALYTLSGHNKGITAFEWSNSGYGSANTNIPPLLGTASHDHTLKLWEVEHGTCYSTLQHDQPVLCLDFSPNHQLISSGGAYQDINIWSIRDSNLITTISAQGPIFALSFSPNSNYLAAATSNFVLLFDARKLPSPANTPLH